MQAANNQISLESLGSDSQSKRDPNRAPRRLIGEILPSSVKPPGRRLKAWRGTRVAQGVERRLERLVVPSDEL